MTTGDQVSFKHTELGSLPTDWDVVPLHEICWFQEGPGLRKWQFTSRGMKVINVTNLVGEIIDLDKTDRHITLAEFSDQYQHFAIDANDIVMASSGNSYGKIALVRDCDLPLMMNTSVIRFKPKERTCFSYIWTFLRSEFFKSQIDLMITGGAQPNFGPYHLNKTLVQLPPLNEQHSIAEILISQDESIKSINNVILKKRDIQKAIMHQLRSGKLRLTGFSGDWKAKKLADISNIKTGSKNNQDKVEDGEYPFYVRSATVERINSYSHDCEAILVPGEGNIGNIFHYIDGRFDVHQRVYAITQFASDVSGKYVHLFMSVHFGAHAMQNSVKATVDSLRLPTFQVFEVLLPPTKEEQIAITNILHDIESEIAALEASRDKARQLKQGMMQELLTGRIRLV